LKSLKSTTYVIHRILNGTIIVRNKILFKFEDNKKQILSCQNKFVLKPNKTNFV